MKNFFKTLPYKHRVAMTILIFTLLPCIFLEAVYLKNVQEDWKHTALTGYQNEIDSCALLMSKNITGLQSKAQYVLNSSSIRSSIAQVNKISLVQALDMISALKETAGSITADNPAIVVRWYPHLCVTSYGDYCYTLDFFADEFSMGSRDACYQKIIALDQGQLLWVVRDLSRGVNNTGPLETRLCLYTQMTNLNGSDCTLEFSIPVSQMFESPDVPIVLDSLYAVCLGQGEEFVNILLDSSFSAEVSETMISEYRQTGKLSGYDVLTAPIPNVANGEVLFILPDSYASELIRPQIITFIVISMFIALLIISASYLTSHFLTKRIIHAINTMNNDLKHLLNESPDSDYSQDDLGPISLCVRKLVQDTQEYRARLERYEAENLRMELELLQMRFNPHLLYNTLGAIRYQVKNPNARSSIDSLCHYYRIVLNNGYLIIKLKDEFEMIKEYLSIEKFAYNLEHISYDFQIEKQVEEYTIIKHLLQPIVENALRHGLRPSGHGGILQIRAAADNGYIHITIADNGVGMSSEEVDQLLKAPLAGTSGHGYGIYNVQQRIKVYYGKEYGLQIDSAVNCGTTVALRIPAIPSEETFR